MDTVTVYVAFYATDWERGYLGTTRYLNHAIHMIQEFWTVSDDDVREMSHHMREDEQQITVGTGVEGEYGFIIVEQV